MPTWNDPKEKLPEPGQQCYLLGETYAIAGPISWMTSKDGTHGMWVDLFGPMSTPEAGTSIQVDTPGLVAWALADEFEMPGWADLMEDVRS